MRYTRIFFLICLLGIIPALAQEEEQEDEFEKRHALAFVFGYAHIPGATKDGKTEEDVFVPSIGVDYFYGLSKKWVVEAVFDMELGSYES